MSEISHLRDQNCCVCAKRLDTQIKAQTRHVAFNDLDFMNFNKTLLNIKSTKQITTADLICGKCRIHVSREKNKIHTPSSGTNIVRVRSDGLFSTPSTSTPATSSPIAKRVPLENPISSSSSDESDSVTQMLNTTLEDIELEELQEIDKNDERDLTLDIPITTKTHRHCLICPRVKTDLRRISHEIQIEFFIKHGIWISEDSRLCSEHFKEDRSIKPEHEDLISFHSNTSVWESKDVLKLIQDLRNSAQKQPQNLFENMNIITENACKNITG